MIKQPHLLGIASLGAAAAAVTVLLPGAKSAPSNDTPFKLGDTTWSSFETFKAAGVRCPVPTPNAEELKRIEQDLALTKRIRRSQPSLFARGAGTVSIPVYFHVITSTSGAGNLTDAQIQSQIDVLNKAYSGQDKLPNNTTPNGAAANTPFRFVLAGVDRTANNTWYTMGYNSTAESQAKATLRVGNESALNIYSANIGDPPHRKRWSLG